MSPSDALPSCRCKEAKVAGRGLTHCGRSLACTTTAAHPRGCVQTRDSIFLPGDESQAFCRGTGASPVHRAARVFGRLRGSTIRFGLHCVPMRRSSLCANHLEVAAALVRLFIGTSATRLLRVFYLSSLSKAVGALARIYFLDRAGDYVALVDVIQVNFAASKYDCAKKVGRSSVRKSQLDRRCTIRVDVVAPGELSGYGCPA